MKSLLIGSCTMLLLFMGVLQVKAQADSANNSKEIVKKLTVVNSKYDVERFYNTTFRLVYPTDAGIMTFRDLWVAKDVVYEMAFNPTGSSFAVNNGSRRVYVYSFEKVNEVLNVIEFKNDDLDIRKNLPFILNGKVGQKLMKQASKGKLVPIAMCYSSDAKHFLLSNSLGEIVI